MSSAEAFLEAPVASAAQALRAGQVTSVALTEAALDRIAARDPALRAFVLLTPDRALQDARRADQELADGRDRGLLHGIPHALKDIFATEGIATTCHSRVRLDHVPTQDCVVAARLAQAGMVLLGKLATHEFAIGGPSEDLPFPPARNPWDVAHSPGGSSSGSGAAIASGMMRAAMGSDTGGSIRGPAAYCGLVGLKPTYGRVSRRGVFPLSFTLDHCGPLGRTVADAAAMFQAIAGHDPHDPASADVPVGDYLSGLDAGVAGLRVGIPRAFFANAPAAAPDVVAEVDRVAALLRDAGAVVEDVALPDFALFAACGRVIMLAEAATIHAAALRTRPRDFGAKSFERFVTGTTVSAPELMQAQRLRRVLTQAVVDAMRGHDLLLTLGSLTPAPRFDETPPSGFATAISQTIAFNVTGHPALAVPTALSARGPGQAGLPIGVQLVARAWQEATLLRAGRTVERLCGWERVITPADPGWDDGR